MKPTQEQLNDPKWWDENIPKWVNHYNTMDGNIYSHEPDIGQEPFCAKRPTKPAFVPEVGEWFTAKNGDNHLYIGKSSSGHFVTESVSMKLNIFRSLDGAKPIKSERELFIEKSIEATGIPKTWSDLLGEMYDAGCRFVEADK